MDGTSQNRKEGNPLHCSFVGVGSDVDKVAEYRAFARMRRAFPQFYTSYEMGNFSRFLIKVSTLRLLIIAAPCS